MDKKEIIRNIKELAILLEVKGANPFKIRALQNGARILQKLDLNIEEALQSGELGQIKGIGKGIIAILKELLETGKCAELEALKSELPAGLLEILKIPGLGAKKVKVLFEKLNITSLGELEYACRENRLVDLAGFGLKSQNSILEGIEKLRQFAKYRLIDEARPLAEQLQRWLKNQPNISGGAIVGQCGMFSEISDKIELLIGTDEPPENLQRSIQEYELCQDILKIEHDRIVFVTPSELEVQLWFSSPDSFIPEKIRRTSSPEIWKFYLGQLAGAGYQFRDGSLFLPNGSMLILHSEAEFFEIIGLPEIPVEIRGSAQIHQHYLRRKTPPLVERKDIQGVIHAHSSWSDGVTGIKEMAEYCRKAGFSYLAISDHSQSAFYANGLTPQRILQQHQEIQQLNEQMTNFKILKSIEVDILPDGSLDYDDSVLAEFDLVIASIHSQLKMEDARATERILKALENPYVNMLGHPTGRLLLGREGYSPDMEKILGFAAENHIAIEINANPRRLDLDWRWIPRAIELGVMLSVNPDAHRLEGIEDIQYGVAMARKGGAESRHILNCLDMDGVLEFCQKRIKK
ncbi:MAG: DNA polymerase/3'-5' exonuclease PolX [Calditrichia bacterium]